jgi:hypothetical protein
MVRGLKAERPRWDHCPARASPALKANQRATYSVTTNQAAIIALFRVINRYVGNLPPVPGVFPDFPAPMIRNTSDLPRSRYQLTAPVPKVLFFQRISTFILFQSDPVQNRTEGIYAGLRSTPCW